MYGILLVLSSTAFLELSEVIGKCEVAKKEESVYTMGFLNVCWTIVGFIFIFLIKPEWFIFSLASLPFISVRIVLEIAQAHFTMKAIAEADRSTFSFVRILTLPLLLLADVILGYHISSWQIAGILVIMTVLVFLFLNHGLSKKGVGFVLFTAINAVLTISLYKYNISHFNSVVAEQLIILLFIGIYFVLMAKKFARENPFSFLKRRVFLIQSLSSSAGAVLISFAYLFGAASIITTMIRTFSVLWSMTSGCVYFNEKKVGKKIFGYIFLIVGLIVLAL